MSLGRDKDESPIEYQIRICSSREEYGLTWDEVAAILNEEFGENFGESKYRKWWYAFKQGVDYVQQVEKEREESVKEFLGNQKKDFQITKNGEQVSTVLCKLSEEQLKDSDYLLEVHGYDPNLWEITSARQSVWNNSLDGELYSSKISVKPRKEFNWSEDNIRNIFEELKDVKFDTVGITHIYEELEEKENGQDLTDKMLMIGIADLHYGLLAKDNLSEEYNMEIAANRFDKIITDVIQRTNWDKSIEKVILLLGNDFLNADNLQGTTSRHFTQQDQETNWYEMITSATKLLIAQIDKLRFFYPSVEVINVKGNHDEMSMFGIMQTLNAYYKDVDAVKINTDSKFRQYIRYGINLIGLSHDEKIANVGKIMAAEAGRDWGETKYRTFLLGHLHHRQLLEDDYGVDVRRMPSVVEASTWTASQGYCGTNKMSESYIFDKENGLIEVLNTVIL